MLDFDAVLRSPSDPTQITPALRYDWFHPNAAGEAVLGRFHSAVDVRIPVGGRAVPAKGTVITPDVTRVAAASS